jgi:hypothetical protein
MTDGDMESDSTGALWTASNCTITKTTTNVLKSRQALHVTSFSTSDTVTAPQVMFLPNTQYLIQIDIYLTLPTDNVTIELGSGTDAIAIGTATKSGWQTISAIVEYTLETAETTALVFTKVGGSASTVDIDSVIILPIERKVFSSPSIIDAPEDLDSVFYFPLGAVISEGTNSYQVWEGSTQPWSNITVLRNELAASGVAKIELRTNKNIDQGLWVRCLKDYTTFTIGGTTADAETTMAPDDIVIDLVYADLLDEWAQEDREEGRLDESAAKEKKSELVRMKLAPRMKQFYKDRGIVQGTIRRNEGL